MAVNKVNYGGKALIDLTKDTVSESSLLSGYTAHKKDGTVITGSFLADLPAEFDISNPVTDSSGNTVTDGAGSSVQGAAVYRKA